jgi:hypothetical protein
VGFVSKLAREAVGILGEERLDNGAPPVGLVILQNGVGSSGVPRLGRQPRSERR